MANKDRERKTVDVLLKSVSDFDGFKDISEAEQERPDFVFRMDNQIIGLEHIEVPILPMKGQDTEKYFKNKTIQLYNNWKDIYDTHYEQVTKALEEHINSKLEAYANFSHTDFIANCAELLGVVKNNKGKRKHNTTEYIELLRNKYSNCDIEVSFVLDVGYNEKDISYYQYRDSPYEAFHTQRILDFPFTWQFLLLLRMIRDVRNVYIIWHPFEDYTSKYVKCYTIRFDENGFMTDDSDIPMVWWEFDMPEGLKKSHVKLNFTDSK